MASYLLRSVFTADKLLRSSLSRLFLNGYWNRISFHTSLYFQAPQILKMPALSPTMSEGTIIKWLKKEGETVQPGDALCDIQTDKAVIAMEVEEEGILAKILMPNDSKDVKVGSPIAVMVEPGEDWKNVEIPTAVSQTSASETQIPTPQPVVPAPSAAATGSGPPGTVVKMPSLSPTMTEGTIVKWLLKEGDSFQAGDGLCEIQTDKAVVTMETDEEGILAKILLPNDTKDVKIGDPIALTVEAGADWKSAQMPTHTQPVALGASSASLSPKPAQSKAPPAPQISAHPIIMAGPAVRNLLQMYNILPDAIKATGPHGKLLKGDVLKHIQANKLTPVTIADVGPPTVTASQPVTGKPSAVKSERISVAPGATFVDIPLSNMRKTIAKRLTESKSTIPHAYASVDCTVDEVHELRNRMKDDGVKVSVNDFVVKAAAAALQRVPDVNVTWTGQDAKKQTEIDISIAVATPDGLITPIVKNAIGRSVEEISSEVKTLAAKARIGKLKPEEFMGGTFTISNLGMFGISWFTAIINPPQAAILAIGSSRKLFTSQSNNDSDSEDEQSEEILTRLQSSLKMTATLSYDSRVVDEDTAARFLQAFREFLETPSSMMTGQLLNRQEFL